MESLQDLLVDELKDVYSAEKQLTKISEMQVLSDAPTGEEMDE
jgi:ferritin-like metal-binding protein YciE